MSTRHIVDPDVSVVRRPDKWSGREDVVVMGCNVPGSTLGPVEIVFTPEDAAEVATRLLSAGSPKETHNA